MLYSSEQATSHGVTTQAINVSVDPEKGRLHGCNEERRACTAPTTVLSPRLSQRLVGWLLV